MPTVSVVVTLTTVLLLASVQVETCMKQPRDLSEFLDWFYPEESSSPRSEKELESSLSDQEKQFLQEQELTLNDVLDNSVPPEGEDLLATYPEEAHVSRWKRSPLVEDFVDGYEDDLEPQGRFERMILNKTDATDNKTATIKELNPGYFEMKFKFEHPELNEVVNGTGNGTTGGGVTPAPAPAA